MNELTKAINNELEHVKPDGLDELHDAGKKWAVYALDTYTGSFLTHALGISKAIAEFTNSIKKDDPRE